MDNIDIARLAANPGDIVVTNFGVYQHWSLVTDMVCENGYPMLISATKRNGTVKEEPWEVVTQGKETYISEVQCTEPLYKVLQRARSQIGIWGYSVTSRNCEHFVKWATGLKVSSAQVVSAVTGAAIGASLVKLIAEQPSVLKYIGGALAVAGIAVYTTKAIEKKLINPNKFEITP